MYDLATTQTYTTYLQFCLIIPKRTSSSLGTFILTHSIINVVKNFFNNNNNNNNKDFY